jgi:transposase
MSYTVAAIDVHKKLLVVVATDVSQPEWRLECRRFGAGAAELHNLRVWLCERGVAEAVMESTAQYWKPVWLELEPHLRLHLAQAQSNRAPKGRKSDFVDAKRLLRRFVAGELFLSFVPEPEQRAWRTVTRGRLQLVRERVQLQGQVESLLEEGRIKLSSVISDLLGASGRRILRALAEGETDPERLAALGDQRLKCGRAVLADALRGRMNQIHRRLLSQHLDRIELLDRQIEELNQLCAAHMHAHQETVVRLIAVPGIGAEAAQEILAEIGPTAAAFPSAAQLASWVGVCPGSHQSADQNYSGHSAKGNRFLRRLLCQAAQAAVKTKRSYLESVFKRLVVRLGYTKAIWAIAHRLCRIIWKILHQGQSFIQRSATLNPKAVRRCINHHLKALRRLGYDLPLPTGAASSCGHDFRRSGVFLGPHTQRLRQASSSRVSRSLTVRNSGLGYWFTFSRGSARRS